MFKITAWAALVAIAGLGACTNGQLVSRAAGTERPAVGGFVAGLTHRGMVLQPVAYDVARINVMVPRTLRISEANSFVPNADIVWHGDPLGDRYAQVTALMTVAAQTGTKAMTVGQAVQVDIEVTRFHALTLKARYTTGGNYATHFLLTVRDVQTGQIIDGPRAVVADILAAGGERAMEEEAAGITQKSVIEGRVAEVLARELSHRLVPAGQAAADPVVSRNAFQPGALMVAQ